MRSKLQLNLIVPLFSGPVKSEIRHEIHNFTFLNFLEQQG